MSHMMVQTIPKGQRHVSVVKGVSLEEVLEKFIQRLILWKKNSFTDVSLPYLFLKHNETNLRFLVYFLRIV